MRGASFNKGVICITLDRKGFNVSDAILSPERRKEESRKGKCPGTEWKCNSIGRSKKIYVCLSKRRRKQEDPVPI